VVKSHFTNSKSKKNICLTRNVTAKYQISKLRGGKSTPSDGYTVYSHMTTCLAVISNCNHNFLMKDRKVYLETKKK